MRAVKYASVVVLGCCAAAAAAVVHPSLRSPHDGQRVHAGQIKLTVKDTGVRRGLVEFVTISPTRKLDSRQNLARCHANGCDFIQLARVHGRPGYWSYTAPFAFPGYWASTPGKYYWQAEHVDCRVAGCRVTSAIHSFRVVP